MTDVPALFYMLVSLYGLTRAAQSASLGWLGVSLLASIIGGMARQTVWLIPLAIIPYLILLHWRDRRFLIALICGWIAVCLDAHFTLSWFARQPWAYVDPTVIEYFQMAWEQPRVSRWAFRAISFTVVMFALPALLPFTISALGRLWHLRRTWRAGVSAVVILLLSYAVSQSPKFGIAPWLNNIITIKGVIGPLELSGNRAYTMSLAARGIVSALVLATCYLMVARAAEALFEPRALLAALNRRIWNPDARCVLFIFAIPYFTLLVVRLSHDLVFDRYCLPLVPCVAILFLSANESGARASDPARPERGRLRFVPAWGALAIYAAYALASTQDNLALAAARKKAVDLLRSHGVPRTQIAAGLEYDFYTQLQEQGHINRAGVKNPPDAFNPDLGYTPAINPRYRLEYPRYTYMLPTSFGEIDYISWLPPFRRKVMIDEFPNPWWLDTTHPHSGPVPRDHEADYEE
jgi:hypothetical protein